MVNDERNAAALILAREWQQTIAALAADTVECLEIVTELTLKPELKGHPYFWGKMSLLQTLRPLADEDVKRFETPEAAKIIKEMERARVIVSVTNDLAAYYRYVLRYVPQDEYDQALVRLEAFESVATPATPPDTPHS